MTRLATTSGQDSSDQVRSNWMEPEQLRLLAAAGISMVPQVVVGSAGEAAAAAATLGLPVAMKVIAADVLHKSDVGGVALGLAVRRCGRRAHTTRWRGGCPG